MSYLVPALVALVGILVTLHIFRTTQRNNRLDKFEKNFLAIYKKDGCVLECLIPGGINNLQDDKEIKAGLERLQNTLGYHPLRTWRDSVEKIGYQKFFKKVLVGPGRDILNKNTIQVFIKSFEEGNRQCE